MIPHEIRIFSPEIRMFSSEKGYLFCEIRIFFSRIQEQRHAGSQPTASNQEEKIPTSGFQILKSEFQILILRFFDVNQLAKN